MADNPPSNPAPTPDSPMAADLRLALMIGAMDPRFRAVCERAAAEIDRLQAELAKLKADHDQFVEWANPQIVTHGKDVMTIEALEARVRELESENNRLQADLAAMTTTLASSTRLLNTEHNRVRELEADARRYRTIREDESHFAVFIPRLYGHIAFNGDRLDFEVDAHSAALTKDGT